MPHYLVEALIINHVEGSKFPRASFFNGVENEVFGSFGEAKKRALEMIDDFWGKGAQVTRAEDMREIINNANVVADLPKCITHDVRPYDFPSLEIYVELTEAPVNAILLSVPQNSPLFDGFVEFVEHVQAMLHEADWEDNSTVVANGVCFELGDHWTATYTDALFVGRRLVVTGYGKVILDLTSLLENDSRRPRISDIKPDVSAYYVRLWMSEMIREALEKVK